MSLLEYQMARHTRSRMEILRHVPEGITDTIKERILELPSSVKTDYLKSQVWSKFVSADTDPASLRRERAIEKWLATEVKNEATNNRLLTTPGDFNVLPGVAWARFSQWCQAFILRMLESETVPVDALLGQFSGGASTSRPRAAAHPSGKYLGKADVTLRALEYFTDLSDEMPGWLGLADYTPCVVSGNVLFTVPKKTDIDRVACKEPDINMFMQKGVGNYIRNRLRRQGIDLNDQSRNQSLARIGSLDGSLATLDLSSASDSISSSLVAEMLPIHWFCALDAIRSPVTVIDGVNHRNEMFSSMGNGFTFELQSMLFYTFARAVCRFKGIRGIVSIYGDDIIIPTAAYEGLVEVLGFLGFSVNPDKSFAEGPFRESCGGHYSDGIDITPFYIKEPVSTLVDIIHVANSVRKWAYVPGCGILNPEVEDLWLWLKSLVPACFWGGGDTSFKYQLTSYDVPHSRIAEVSQPMQSGLGGYFHWLNTTWDRRSSSQCSHFDGDGVKTSSYTKPLNEFRVRRVDGKSAVPRLPALFLSEVG